MTVAGEWLDWWGEEWDTLPCVVDHCGRCSFPELVCPCPDDPPAAPSLAAGAIARSIADAARASVPFGTDDV